MTNSGMRFLSYPPPGAIIVMSTTPLRGDFRVDGNTKQCYTHVTVMLPGIFANDAEALTFIRTLPPGGYSIERAR